MRFHFALSSDDAALATLHCRSLASLTFIVVLLLIFPFAAIAGPFTADLVVSPTGSDRNPGTAARPLRSLEAARNRLRDMTPAMIRDLVVAVRGGDYYCSSPLRLGSLDSGTKGHTVIWRNWPGEHPRLIGGRRITGWRADANGVYAATVAPGWRFQTLFCNGERMTKARFPKQGYLQVVGADPSQPQQVFRYNPADIPSAFHFGPEAQVYIWAGYDWFTDTSPIVSIEGDNASIHLAKPALCNIMAHGGRRYFLQGIREALTEPGEFFLDYTQHTLYIKPPAGKTPQNCAIVAPTLTRLIEIRGNGVGAPTHHVRIEGLELTVSDFGERFDECDGTHGVTCWNEPANLDALVYCENAVDCAIRACYIHGAGYSGVSLARQAKRIEVWGNEISDCGYHGVLLAGYSPRYGDPPPDLNRENRVVNNHIYRCGRLVGHGAGIFVHSSGFNSFAHNLIHDMPRYGICTKGQYDCPPGKVWEEWNERANHSQNNSYEDNIIHDVNLDSEDSGFISFMSAGRHNVVRGNVLHSCPRNLGGLAQGIYLDDGTGYTLVEQNLLYDLEGVPGKGIGSSYPIMAKGIYNVIQDNVIIGGPKSASAIMNFSMGGRQCSHHTYQRNVICLTGATTMINCANWEDARFDLCDKNLYWAGQQPVTFTVGNRKMTLAEWQQWAGKPLDANSRVADPAFVDPAHHDYRLLPNSPALATGFQARDWRSSGLLPDFPFSRPREAD